MNEQEYNAAFLRLYERYFEKLSGIASYFTVDAESMVQDVFVRVHNKHEEIDVTQPEKIEGLLYKILCNRCIDQRRSDKTRKKAEQRYEELAALDNETFWELAEMDEEMACRVAAVIQQSNQLPEASQRVIKAVFLEGMTIKEYAEKYGITTQSAHNLKNKALDKLRKKSGDDNLHILLLIILLFSGPWKN